MIGELLFGNVEGLRRWLLGRLGAITWLSPLYFTVMTPKSGLDAGRDGAGNDEP